jgi:hypothetical protein
MTPQANRTSDLVDEILLDSGHAEDEGLRAALLSLGSLASLPAPAPSGELAALLAGSRDELAQRRRLRRHRSSVVGLAVIAGMGLGIGGVAATSGVSAPGAGNSIQQLLEDWAPGWSPGSGTDPAAVPGDGSSATASYGEVSRNVVSPDELLWRADAGNAATRLLPGLGPVQGNSGGRAGGCGHPVKDDAGAAAVECVPLASGSAHGGVPADSAGAGMAGQEPAGSREAADRNPGAAGATGPSQQPGKGAPAAVPEEPGAAGQKTALPTSPAAAGKPAWAGPGADQDAARRAPWPAPVNR